MSEEVTYVDLTIDLDGQVIEMEIPDTVTEDEIVDKLEILGGRRKRH